MEKMGFGMAPRRCGIHSKSQKLLQKTFIFHASETLAAYAGVCLHMHTLATYVGRWPLWFFISKNIFFAHLKSYIFHFNSPQVNLVSDCALN